MGLMGPSSPGAIPVIEALESLAPLEFWLLYYGFWTLVIALVVWPMWNRHG
jgi:hypothetical protein